ncbi:MAG: sigma-70 family RNA polymerase sigma factor [Planctomycetaceae bacterium]|nr:sigma-70 family RNA polymerase sigma factor [Planctomycetaceae bacterium]
MPADAADKALVARIRGGEADAWQECIDRFEGRLIAFVVSRLGNRSTAEDVVQETFIGFLTSLPNYDENTPLESFLFAIAAHKLTDVLRREGRRPTLPLMADESHASAHQPPARTRVASSMARSRERKSQEESVVADCLQGMILQWIRDGEYERLKCMELLFVQGRANKEAAARLGISEQAVANHKHFVVSKLKDAGRLARVQDFDLSAMGISE